MFRGIGILCLNLGNLDQTKQGRFLFCRAWKCPRLPVVDTWTTGHAALDQKCPKDAPGSSPQQVATSRCSLDGELMARLPMTTPSL